MADNTILEQAVTAGDTLATDDIGAYKIPISKIHTGADGVDGGAVTAANAFPVDIASATVDLMEGTDFSDVLGTANLVATDGSTALTLGLHALGTDGTNAQILSTNTSGHLNIADGGNSISIDAASLPLPSGAATSANQSTGNTSLGNIDTNTTDVPNVIGTDGAAGPTLALSIGGTEAGGNFQELRVDSDGHPQVDVLSNALPTGAATEATLATVDTNTTDIPNVIGTDGLAGPSSTLSVGGTESGGNIQELRVDSDGHLQVDVLSGGGGGTQYAVNDPAGATDTGTLALVVRDDTLTTLTPPDSDYVQMRTNNRGALWVEHDGNLTVDAGTGWMSGYTEDAAGAGGEEGPFTIGRRQDADTSPVGADGDYHGLIFNDEGGLKTVDKPVASGGLSMHKTISAASDNATNVKASAGQLYAVQVFNTNASARYLKLYDKATAPTVGTDTPVKTLLIPGNITGAGMVLNWDKGLEFTAGIGFGLTTGIADSDTNAVAANEIAVDLDYR